MSKTPLLLQFAAFFNVSTLIEVFNNPNVCVKPLAHELEAEIILEDENTAMHYAEVVMGNWHWLAFIFYFMG